MHYYSNEFGMVFSHDSYPANPSSTALIQRPQWDGSTQWAIGWTDSCGRRHYEGEYPTMLTAYRAAKRQGVWR